ncbi:MAG: FAD:protein FMN transferase [Clostridia bacterium]|nr:FAD:protein FMN transferase [Clostridia bacterium]
MKVNEKSQDAKTPVLRIVAFVIAITIAVGAFTAGIVSLNKRDEGWYEITPNPSEDGTFYSGGMEFLYYFAGGSNEIRQMEREIAAAYSIELERMYKLFDPENTYEGYVNLASLNQSEGKWLGVSEELYEALKTAHAYTAEGAGYSVFSGELYREWEGLVYLMSPAESDPLSDAAERARLDAITAALGAEDAVRLELRDGSREVRLTRSEEYKRAETELELAGAPLDFGLLRDVFTVEYVAAALAERGFKNGIFQTVSGVTYSMADNEAGQKEVLGFADGKAQALAAFDVPAGTLVCECRAFARTEDEAAFYTVEADGGTVYRSLHYDARSGDCPDTVLSAYAVSTRSSGFASVAYDCLRLFLSGAKPASSGTEFYYTLKTAPEQVR